MYSVLTYIFKNGDILRSIPIEEGIEYICVTDDPNLKQDGWRVIVDSDLNGLNPIYASFYVRYHPFKYCKGNICLRIDGTVKIHKPLLSFFKEFEKSNKDIMVMVNSRSSSLFKEYFHWGMSKESIAIQKTYCIENGIDIHKKGSLQSPISITRNNELCNQCDALCWDLIDKCSTKEKAARPSQAIMTIAIEQTKGLDIMFVDGHLFKSDTFSWHRHCSEMERHSYIINPQKSFFDKPIEIYKFNAIHYKPEFIQPQARKRVFLEHIFNFKKFKTP